MNIHFASHSNPEIITPAQMLANAAEEMGSSLELYCEDRVMANKPHWAFDNYRLGGAIDYGGSHLFYTQPGWGKFFEEKMGRNKVKCVTYAIDENVYPEEESKKIYDVGFIGNVLDGDGRQEYLDAINERFNCFISTKVGTRGITKALSQCKVVFNHIRYEEINIRFFEALASGAQVVSYSPALHLYAKEGEHYLTYKTPEEAIEKIQYLLDNPMIARQMKEKARTHVINNHTYKHRLKEMEDFI